MGTLFAYEWEHQGSPMTVTLHTREIRINVEEGTLNHLIVKNFVEKYFSNVMKLSGTLIIFHNESELSQKRYFFQWLYAAYRKKHQDISPAFLKMLQSAVSFPIRVRVQGKRKPVQSISVRLWLSGVESFALAIEPETSLAPNYFRHRFQPWLKRQIAPGQFEVTVCAEALNVLSELLSRDQILAQPVVYRYDKIQIDRLFGKRNEESQAEHQKQRFYKLVIEEDNKLKEAYKLLGCTADSDAENIKRCYREMARRFHPDRAFSEGEVAVAELTRRFHAINEAYSLICEQAKSA